MKGNEAPHATKLADRRAALFGDAPRAINRAMPRDVEAPEYDEARACMTPRQAMETALRSEEKAHAVFVAALPSIRAPELRALFEELRDEEVHHRDLIRRPLAKLPVEPAIDPEDFTDEPTSQ